MKHKTCNHEYLVKPNVFLQGRRCPYCCYKVRIDPRTKSTEEFKKEVYDLVKDEYEVLGEYINNKTKILMKHKTCNHEYLVRPNDFQQGYRCPNCHINEISSKNLKIVEKYFNDNSIKFEKEKKFNDLKRKNLLSFDYFIPDYNLLIEFDGQQHFIIRKNTMYENSMPERVERDWIKNQWIENHNYKLIRIPFSLSLDKLKILIKIIIKNELNLNFLDENNIYYYDGFNTYNKLKYYSKHNSLYFTKYSEEIENSFRKNFNNESCL